MIERRSETRGVYEPLGAGELAGHDDRGLRLRSGTTTVEVTALAPDLFRVGMFPEGRTPRYRTEAIAKESWEPVEISMQESDHELTLSTTAATAHVFLNPLRVKFTDDSGREFAADDEDLGMGPVVTPGADVFSQPLGSPVRLYKKRQEGERYFGCGERTSGLEKTGSHQVFWNVDPPEGHTASFNNLYSSIPSSSRWRAARPTASSSTTLTAPSSTSRSRTRTEPTSAPRAGTSSTTSSAARPRRTCSTATHS